MRVEEERGVIFKDALCLVQCFMHLKCGDPTDGVHDRGYCCNDQLLHDH